MTASKGYAGLFAAFDLGGMYGVPIHVVNILDILFIWDGSIDVLLSGMIYGK